MKTYDPGVKLEMTLDKCPKPLFQHYILIK